MTDLDSALRSMLRERANDIESLPADFADLASLDVLDHDPIHDRPRRPRTAWLIAAAIVAVLAVVGTAIALQGKSGPRRVPPATRSATGTPTATPVPPPPALQRRATCAAPLPARWSTALSAATSRYGSASAMPLAVAPDGSAMLVARDFGQSRDVALVRSNGSARSIYSVPQPDENQVVNASLDDQHAAIDLDRLPRNSNGVIPAARQVLLVTLSTGAIKQLDQVSDKSFTSVPQGRTIDGSLLWNGHVYWDVRPTYTARTTTIEDYDIATGTTTVAGHGGAWIPQLLAGGVTFDPQGTAAVAVPRAVPPLVATAGHDGAVHTDGQTYSWTTTTQRLAWWGPGQTTIAVFTLPDYADPHPEAVVGPYVLLDDTRNATGHRLILDARTGAIAVLPQVQPFLLTADGTLVGYRFAGAFKSSQTEVIRLDTSALPELSC